MQESSKQVMPYLNRINQVTKKSRGLKRKVTSSLNPDLVPVTVMSDSPSGDYKQIASNNWNQTSFKSERKSSPQDIVT